MMYLKLFNTVVTIGIGALILGVSLEVAKVDLGGAIAAWIIVAALAANLLLTWL